MGGPLRQNQVNFGCIVRVERRVYPYLFREEQEASEETEILQRLQGPCQSQDDSPFDGFAAGSEKCHLAPFFGSVCPVPSCSKRYLGLVV